MTDLISRKALLAEYDRVHVGPPGGARKLMEDAPAVQQWIPVTERFPDLELVEVRSEDMDLFPCLVSKNTQKLRKGKLVTKAWYDGIGFLDSDCIDITKEVTHWMPLPEPPKGE
jgi:hypothetical protein